MSFSFQPSKGLKPTQCMGTVLLPGGPSVLSWAGWGGQGLPGCGARRLPAACLPSRPGSRARSPFACLVSSCNQPVYCSEKVKLVGEKKG